MAPEFPPVLVIFKSRFEDSVLKGIVEYVESGVLKPNQRLRVRWNVESQPRDYRSVGEGVAYVYDKDNDLEIMPISEDASPNFLGNDRYLWTEGLQSGLPWLMFILILPKGYTLDDPLPRPAGTKIFKDRLAFYWTLRGDDLDRTTVQLTMKKLQGDFEPEIIRINKAYLANETFTPSTIEIEDTPLKKEEKKPKWWIVAILAPIIVGLVIALSNVLLQESTESKYGELLIECNLDSAEIYLNRDFKGLTSASEILKLESLKPGNYILNVKKGGYQTFIDDKVKIASGELTSKKISLEKIITERLTGYIKITIQTPIRDKNWNAVDVARRGEKFKFTGKIIESPKGNKYYEIELGKYNISKAYIWNKESELIKDK